MKKAIVCVDDEAIILLSLVQELKKTFGNNFIYEQALNADIGMEIVTDLIEEGIQVILIISDWLMPGMKGDEFVKKIHNDYPDIKALIITGHADQGAIDQLTQNDFVIGVLTKPWNPNQLVSMINPVLN